VAAGQAACGLELGLARGEAGHDLVKSRDPGGRIKGVLLAASVVTEVPEVEPVEPCLGVLGSRLVGAAAQPGVDVAGGLLAVADADRDGPLARDRVAAGEDPWGPGHERCRVDLHN